MYPMSVNTHLLSASVQSSICIMSIVYRFSHFLYNIKHSATFIAIIRFCLMKLYYMKPFKPPKNLIIPKCSIIKCIMLSKLSIILIIVNTMKYHTHTTIQCAIIDNQKVTVLHQIAFSFELFIITKYILVL